VTSRRPVLAAMIVIGFASVAAASPPQPAAVTLTLKDATDRALASNRELKVRALEQTVARTDILIAGERPNPEIAYEGSRETPHQALTVSVPLEIASKRARRVEFSRATSTVVAAEYARDAADLRTEVRRAFYELVAADRRIDAVRQLSQLATRARDAARARFESGAAPQLDVVQADLALARAENLEIRARGDRAGFEAQLCQLIGLAADTRLEPIGDLFTDGTASLPQGGPDAMSVDLALAARQLDSAQSAVAIARALRYPDPTFVSGLTYDSPPEFTYGWRAGVALTVPLFTTHRAGVLKAEQIAAQASAAVQAVEFATTGRARAALSRAGALKDALDGTRARILPGAETVARMAQESYDAGQTGMVALLQSLQASGETRLEAIDTALEFQLALADLERARGVPLP
jgi:outer membrane protein TolC